MPVQEQRGGGGITPNRSAISALEGGGDGQHNAPAALPPLCVGLYVDIRIRVYLLQVVIFLNDHCSHNIELVTTVIYRSILVVDLLHFMNCRA